MEQEKLVWAILSVPNFLQIRASISANFGIRQSLPYFSLKLSNGLCFWPSAVPSVRLNNICHCR